MSPSVPVGDGLVQPGCVCPSVLPSPSTVSMQPQFLLGQEGSECGKTRPSSGALVMQKVSLAWTSSIKMAE